MTRRLCPAPAWACSTKNPLLRALLILLLGAAAAFPLFPSAFAAPRARRLSRDGHTTPLAWAADGETLFVRRPGALLPGQRLSELWALDLHEGERLISDNALYPAVQGERAAYLRYLAHDRWLAIVHPLDGSPPVPLGEAQPRMPPTWIEDSVVYLDPAGQPVSAGEKGLGGTADSWMAQEAQVWLSRGGQYAALNSAQGLRVLDRAGQAQPVSARPAGAAVWSPSGDRLAFTLPGDEPAPELWVWSAAEGARRLVRTEMSHFDAPAWSPDGRTLAWSRHPTGSGPNAAGDIWLVDVDGGHARPLAETAADERAPVWSPDGTRLALEVEGDVWVIDPTAPDLEGVLEKAGQEATPNLQDGSISALSIEVPSTIRVIHDDAGNLCRDVPDGQIDEYPFEAYLQRVVPNEVPASWPAETLKAQAVAARTYAWRRVINMRQEHPELGYDVWDSTRDQYMCDPTPEKPLPDSTNAAVEATVGQYVRYANAPIYAFYCAEAGSPTNYKQELNLTAAPYLRPVDDPVSFGQVRRGHSWGMSQWGAYRWAAWHGWDYVQILNHYYASAAVSGSVEPAPVVGLALPWPDFYLRAGYAYLQANAAGASQVLTVTFAADTDGTWTTIYTDTTDADGWSYVWSVAGIAETATPSIGLRATAYDSAGRVGTSTVSRIGVHRTPPTGTLGIAQATVYTTQVTLDLQASDPDPVDGALRYSLSNADWAYEDGEAELSGGKIVSDPLAGDGRAWHLAATTAGALRIAPDGVLPDGGRCRALFRIRAPVAALNDPRPALILEATAADGKTLLGRRYLRGTDLRGTGYEEVSVDWVAISGARLELRTEPSAFDVWVDRVRVVSYPAEVVPQARWTLPSREGPATVTARYMDRAGNASADVSLVLHVVDDSPPGGWRAFGCTGSTCSVQVQDAIAGLDVDSARYRTSSDGGGSWSQWRDAACTGSHGSHDWETITAEPGAGPTPSVLLIQFAITDAAAAANPGISPAYGTGCVYLPLLLADPR